MLYQLVLNIKSRKLLKIMTLLLGHLLIKSILKITFILRYNRMQNMIESQFDLKSEKYIQKHDLLEYNISLDYQ